MIKFHWLEVGQPLQDTCTNSQYFIYRLYRYNKTEWREGFNSQHSVPLQQPLIILLPTLCRNLREEHFRNFNFRITNQRPAGFFFFFPFGVSFSNTNLKVRATRLLFAFKTGTRSFSQNLAAGFEAKQSAAPFSQPPAVPCWQEQTPALASERRRCDSRTLREQICRVRRCYFYKVTLHCETTNIYRERKVLRQRFAELCAIPWAAGKGWLWPQAQQEFHIERLDWRENKICSWPHLKRQNYSN